MVRTYVLHKGSDVNAVSKSSERLKKRNEKSREKTVSTQKDQKLQLDLVYDNSTILWRSISEFLGLSNALGNLLYLSDLASGTSIIDTQMRMKPADKHRNSHILGIRIKKHGFAATVDRAKSEQWPEWRDMKSLS